MKTYSLDAGTFALYACGDCGIQFLVPSGWDIERRVRGKHGANFVCPNGHSRIWAEPEIDEIRRERDRLKQNAAFLEGRLAEEGKRASLAEARERRLKRRAREGVCPCCKRTFSNMARHMKSKHPEYGDNVVKLAPFTVKP